MSKPLLTEQSFQVHDTPRRCATVAHRMPPMPADDTPSKATPEPTAVWSVYVVRRSDGALYTGIATDVERRLEEHEAGEGRGAKALRGRGPLTLVFAREVGGRSLATRIEARIKRLSKARKERWIHDETLIDRILELLPDDGIEDSDEPR
jgi:putative endonuclease